MMITNQNDMLFGCSEDLKNDFEWAAKLLQDNPGDVHTLYMTMTYLIHRGRTDLAMTLFSEDEKEQGEALEAVKSQNEMALEYRRAVSMSSH